MFDKNFYPTPKNIALKLLEGISGSLRDEILEPSAGKGDILDVYKTIVEKENFHPYSYSKELNNVYCIEKNIELQSILRSKKYKVIDSDFLNYNPEKTFDYIVMNPPFDIGYKHFLKAWEISHNTEIRCLLPETTIKNPSNKEMYLVNQIIKDNNGSIEYLGNCFSDAERKTNVNVVLIKVKRTKNTSFDFDFKPVSNNEKKYTFEDIENNQVASIDVFENLETRYNKVKEIYLDILNKQQELLYYSNGLLLGDPLEFIPQDVSNPNNAIMVFSEKLKKECWDYVFSNTKFSNIVTSSVRKKFDEFRNVQGDMAFNKENLENLFDDLFQNKQNIMKQCIEESFDIITKYHEDNRVYIEGWKTNERYKANKKFILPFTLESFWADYIRLSYGYRNNDQTILDIEKGLAFIIGKKLDQCDSIVTKFNNKEITKYGKWYDSEFFEFKCFKKGTIHFKFKSEELWDKFNKISCENKKWLGN